ncbi:MAG: 50S ribosomal protein L32 [Bacteroidia bacterium]|nr:50S ribosomal protein L32 [Bacteroidia bacterium]
MPHPKRRQSSTRRDKRRTHDKLIARPFYIDPITGEATLYHRVNLTTGRYKGQQVFEGKEE